MQEENHLDSTHNAGHFAAKRFESSERQGMRTLKMKKTPQREAEMKKSLNFAPFISWENIIENILWHKKMFLRS